MNFLGMDRNVLCQQRVPHVPLPFGSGRRHRRARVHARDASLQSRAGRPAPSLDPRRKGLPSFSTEFRTPPPLGSSAPTWSSSNFRMNMLDVTRLRFPEDRISVMSLPSFFTDFLDELDSIYRVG